MMDTNTTLQQGLENFQGKNKKYFAERQYSEKGKEFLRCHDIAHVIFGCDTTIYGEGTVKVWTTFGTTLSFWSVVKGYQEVSAFELFKAYSVRHILKNIMRFIAVIPNVIIRSKRMSKPWPFPEYKPYMDTPISEIRKEFNIQVLDN